MKQGHFFIQRTWTREWKAGICMPSGDEIVWNDRFETPEAAREECRAGRRKFEGADNWAIQTREATK